MKAAFIALFGARRHPAADVLYPLKALQRVSTPSFPLNKQNKKCSFNSSKILYLCRYLRMFKEIPKFADPPSFKSRKQCFSFGREQIFLNESFKFISFKSFETF